MTNYEMLYESFFANPQLLEDAADQDIKIDRDGDLSEYLHTNSNLYFKWARLASIAEGRAAKQKYRVKEELLPLARENARKALKATGDKATAAQVEDVALVNVHYRQGQNLLVELETLASTLKSAANAMAQRQELLRSINGRQRVELSGYPNDDGSRG